MADAIMADTGDSDQQMSALFARRLPQAPLPPGLVQRTQQAVLDEVRRTHRPAPVQRPASVGALEQIRRWWRSLSPGQSLVMSGAVAAFGLLLLMGLTQLAPQPQAAVVTVRDGALLVLRNESNAFRTFYDGDLLKVDEGDHLISIESSVLLTPFETQLTTLEPGTHLEIVALAEEFGDKQVELLVHRGSLRSTIDAELGANDRYIVRTPILTVSATGTDFSVETQSNTETRVTVMTGTVTVQMDDQHVAVSAGQRLDAIAGESLQVESSGLNPGGDLLVIANVDATPLIVRTAPASDADIIGAITASTVLQLNQRDSSAEWLHVCCVADRSGWINLADLATVPLLR